MPRSGVIIGTARDAAGLLEPLFAQAEAEKLVVVHLDGERRVIGLDEFRLDSRRNGLLPTRAIMDAAVRRGSEGLVIGRSHPGGDPEPSQADIDATRLLFATAENLGIRLYDHLIFAVGSCRSFRELGLL